MKIVKRMSRKFKVELASAIVMAVVLSSLTLYVNTPKRTEAYSDVSSLKKIEGSGYDSSSPIQTQQVISEDIQGELNRGSFETVVEGLRNLTFHYDGSIPFISMLYENEAWKGSLNCKVPTKYVTSYTFKVRELIGQHGKVTHISITIREITVNTTQHPEEPLSDISISLKEPPTSGIPAIGQIGGAVPYLVTSLVWVAQGLIVGLPLCFVSLGIATLVNRGIVPVWKKQLKAKAAA